MTPAPFTLTPDPVLVTAVSEALAVPERPFMLDAVRSAGARLDAATRQVLGPLATLIDDPAVTDVFVNGAGPVWCDRGEGTVPTSLRVGDAEARRLAVALVAAGGRHLDDAAPCVDVRLVGGIRVHAVLPPLATTGTAVSIRVPRAVGTTLDELDAQGYFPAGIAEVVREAVADRRNVLITGAAGSGKTTLLAALLGAANPRERIVLIEDVAELQIQHPHVVSLESRQANWEGAGAVELATLLRQALRMRPDRLVVGECRGPEVRELLSALNTGHDGGAGTLHANSLADVPARLEALGVLAGLDPLALARQAVSAFDLVLHVERVEGRRRLAAAGWFRLDAEGRLEVRAEAPPDLRGGNGAPR